MMKKISFLINLKSTFFEGGYKNWLCLKLNLKKIVAIFLISVFILISSGGISSGKDLSSSIDTILKAKQGIAAVADYNTGELLYYFNNIDDGTRAYAPGSTIKLILSMLLIQDGIIDSVQESIIDSVQESIIDTDFKVDCYSSSSKVPIEQRCWDIAGHGMQNFSQAFANSCNRFFLQAAAKVKQKDFIESLKDFSLIDKRSIEDKVIPADMIGLGLKLPVNPLDVLSAYTAVLNGGILYRWYGILNEDYQATVKKNVKITKPLSGKIKDMMIDTSVYGTSSEAVKKSGLNPFPAKTGTAYYSYEGAADYKKTHGWFVGFYPKDDTKIAVLVFVLEGKGAKEASFLGAEIINEYIKSNK
jgi:cell division protein FtsI/penicillin-binding protein 2